MYVGAIIMEENSYLITRDKRVTKANELIQKSHFSLSLQQQKIVLYLISQIAPYDEDFKLYTFSIPEFCKICGIDETSGKNYEDLKKAIKEIADKSIWITREDGKQTLVRWIEKPYIDEGSGSIQIRLDNDMRPYLLQLKENFTSYELIWTLHFRSKFTIRLYELIKSIHFRELESYKRQYPIEELKRLLDGEIYKEYKDFKRRVLKPAIKEINRYSDKNAEFQEIKAGRKVVAIELSVASKDTFEAVQIRSDIEKEMGTDRLTLWDTLKEEGLV